MSQMVRVMLDKNIFLHVAIYLLKNKQTNNPTNKQKTKTKQKQKQKTKQIKTKTRKTKRKTKQNKTNKQRTASSEPISALSFL